MAARTPRRSFAAPFVVTLAAGSACYVQSSPPRQGPPPQPPPTTSQPTQPGPQPPPVIVNPPRPTQPTTTQTEPPPPPSPTPTPPPVAPTSQKWSVYKTKDGTCMAAVNVECRKGATCNPPPPFKYDCPPNMSLEQPVTVALMPDGQSCQVEYPMPKCPQGVACNPPRPTPVACPKR